MNDLDYLYCSEEDEVIQEKHSQNITTVHSESLSISVRSSNEDSDVSNDAEKALNLERTNETPDAMNLDRTNETPVEAHYKLFDPGGAYESSLNIRDYFRPKFVPDNDKMGNVSRKTRKVTVSTAQQINYDSDDYSSDLGGRTASARLQNTDPFTTIWKRQSGPISELSHLKRPSDFECSSDRTSYQIHVKTDEDIALDICNTFWRPGLTFSSYKHGGELMCFESLWPKEDSLRNLLNEAYQATSLRRSVLDITKLALRCAPVTLIQELINSRIVTIDQIFENGSTMLHLACIARNADVVTFLCNNGINVRSQDKYGRTAEQVCFDPRIKRLLPYTLHRTASATNTRCQTPSFRKQPQNHDRETIFALAKQLKQYDELFIRLQTFEFDVNEERNIEGDYLLHCIVRGGLCQLPQLLSLVRDFGADVDSCNSDGMTPLMIAAASGNTVLVDVLQCVLGANPNSPNPLNGCCAMHYAVIYNRADVTNCLIKRGADFNLEDYSSQRPDDLAKVYRSVECEEIILRERKSRVDMLARHLIHGCLNSSALRVTDLYQVTEEGETLIMMAAKYNRISNLRILIGREGCPIDAQHGVNGKTALAMACVNGHAIAVQILMSHDANVSLKDVDGYLPIHHAVLNDSTDVIDIILQYQRALVGLHVAYKNTRSQRARNLLKHALHRRQTEIITPALFEMSLTGDAESLFSLLEDGDDINPVSGVGNWPLYLAAEYGHLDVVMLLHHLGGDITKKHPSSKNTILHAACERGHVQIVKHLLKYCSSKPLDGQLDINGLNNDKKSPLRLASEKGSRRIVAMLLDHGASTALVDENGELISCPQYLGIQVLIENRRQLHMMKIDAALKDKKNIAALQAVFESRYDHNLRDTNGDTPLMLACRYGNILAVKYLLVSVNETEEIDQMGVENAGSGDSDDDSGISAANMATGGAGVVVRRRTTSAVYSEDDVEHHWMLASTGHSTRPNPTKPPIGAHSMFLASDQFQSKIRPNFYSRSTLNLGSDDGSRQQSIFALHSGDTHVSDINPIDCRSAMHRALESGDHVGIVQALAETDRGCVNIQDRTGLSPLHLAFKLGRKKCIQKLVTMAYVDLNLRTLDGRLPEEMTNNKRLANLIQASRGDISRSSEVSGSVVDFSDSASQYGVKSTVLDFEDLNERFNRMKAKVFKRDKNS